MHSFHDRRSSPASHYDHRAFAADIVDRQEDGRRTGREHSTVGRCDERERRAVRGDSRVHENEAGAHVEAMSREAQVHERHCRRRELERNVDGSGIVRGTYPEL